MFTETLLQHSRLDINYFKDRLLIQTVFFISLFLNLEIMKKLFIILALAFYGCSSEDAPKSEPTATCYDIIAIGIDARGDYIIVDYGGYTQKRYSVTDYQDYIGQNKICEPINLTEQSL